MNVNPLNDRPRIAATLQIALLVVIFQGVVATTPSTPETVQIESGFSSESLGSQLRQPLQ